MKHVFISSVMKGFDEERKAARRAVESLRMRAVIAEDFGAKPHSSQVACLEGVRSAEVYVLILGKRYGFVAKSGVSATEEEFLEARRRGLPVLVFVQSGDREPDQQAFFERLGGYEEGYFVAFFDNPHDLQTKVTTALHDLVGQPGVSTLKPDEARERARVHLAKRITSQDAVLTVITIPTRQGEEYVPVLEMGGEEFKSAIAQRAMFGRAAIFRAQDGFRIDEEREHVRLVQGDRRGLESNGVEIHADGTLVWRVVLGGNEKGQGWSLVRGFVVDQDEVRKRLTAFWNFAHAHYGALEASSLISSLFATVAVGNISQKMFGKLPDQEPSGMQMPMTPIDDPLVVPAQPMKVARAELAEADKLAEKFVGLIGRAFKAAGREYGKQRPSVW